MADERKQTEVKAQQRSWDIPHLIKWILLIFLFLLLAAEMGAGEFNRLSDGFGGWAWIILLLKIILIIDVKGSGIRHLQHEESPVHPTVGK